MTEKKSELDQLRETFIEESKEALARVEKAILAMEDDPSNLSAVDDLFRTMHSIKGSAGIVDLPKLVAVAHCAEDLLSQLRTKVIKPSREVAEFLLQATDILQAMLLSTEAGKGEGDTNIAEIVAIAKSIVSRKDESHGDDAAAHSSPKHPQSSEKAQTNIETFDKSIKVSQELLDSMLNMIGELVLVRNQLASVATSLKSPDLTRGVGLLNQITQQLQDSVMRTRMQAVGTAWTRLPRLVREVSGNLGKKIKLECIGAETEIDRNLIATILDPIVHCIRNSVGHGIEHPEARLKAVKPEVGTITLAARQESGFVWIDIMDDGAGINADRIKKKALDMGLIDVKKAETMGRSEILDLIFHPGFSTADAVTELSGRGVGMDVLKKNSEKAGGAVSVDTKLGHGTKVSLKLPLTLAIVPAIVIGSGNAKFAIPQVMVSELVLLSEESQKNLTQYADCTMYRMGSAIIPVIDLESFLDMEATARKQEEEEKEEEEDSPHGYLLIVQVDGNRAAIRVETILDTQEVVIKPAGSLIQRIGYYSGTTVLGDGSIIMVLDIPRLVEHLRLKRADSALAQQSIVTTAVKSHEKVKYLILKSANQKSRIAFRAGDVLRIEKISQAQIELFDDRSVIQSRGAILPIHGDIGQMDEMHLIVLRESNSEIAVIASDIVDFLEIDETTKIGPLESFVAFGHSTQILNPKDFRRSLKLVQALPEEIEPTPEVEIEGFHLFDVG